MKKAKMTNKSLSMLVAVALLACTIFGGTLAWLVSQTDTVVNTFTYGDIDLALDETLTDEKGNPVDENGRPIPDGEDPVKTTEGNTYEMLPGEEYLKDPAVTVVEGNEACWLFVKLTEEGLATITKADGTTETYKFDDYLEYAVVNEWNLLSDKDGEAVYYRFVGEDTDNQKVVYQILVDNKVAVKDSVTKDMLNALDNNGQADPATVKYPKLSVTAYAIQYSGFEPVDNAGNVIENPTADQLKAAAEAAWKEVAAQAKQSIILISNTKKKGKNNG